MQLFSRLRTHSRAAGPRRRINSGRMSSIHAALPGEIQEILCSSLSAENGSTRSEDDGFSSVSSQYCWYAPLFLCLSELFPFRNTCCATLLAVTLVWFMLVVGSFESLRMRAYAFLSLYFSQYFRSCSATFFFLLQLLGDIFSKGKSFFTKWIFTKAKTIPVIERECSI